MRWGKDGTYSITKNNKGEYVFDKKSCTGTLPTAGGGVSVTAPASPQEAAGMPPPTLKRPN